MLKEFTWNTFMKSGIIDSYLLYREIEERDRTAKQKRLAEAEAATSSS